MNAAVWKERFKANKLPKLLETWHDEWREDGHFNSVERKSKILDEGADFVRILKDDYCDTEYRFGGERCESLTSSLAGAWEISDFTTETSNRGAFTYIGITCADAAVDFVFENSGRSLSCKIEVTAGELPERAFIREAVKQAVLAANFNGQINKSAVKQLYSQEELVSIFGDAGLKLSIPVDKLDLSVRPYALLKRDGFETVFEIAYGTQEDIAGIFQLGRPSFDQIIEKMEKLGVPWNIKEKLAFV